MTIDILLYPKAAGIMKYNPFNSQLFTLCSHIEIAHVTHADDMKSEQ